MNWFGNYFSRFPEDVSLLNIHSPLLLSLRSSEDEQHFISSTRSHGPAQAVTKQPVWGDTGRTTIMIVPTGGDWSSGLFSVCRDKRICFCGLFCPMCLECDIARHHGECLCWPLLPGSTFALRVGTRERHKIRVARELKMRASQLYEICAAPSTKDNFI
ncbi:PLAC8-like protein 1 isoform X2 [Herpailurus yagouaroundi]|uniref:PLAC8-like protein 1 isoform X2 n=1 Tax=Herpailurus yagouaroundi TaxID=1608482 RepID=UPI001AD641FA|nr:PLAC8-like protein 1 isoform X2 [Puma yagouaroundi]